MSCAYNGAQARIMQNLCPCACHSLNVCGVCVCAAECGTEVIVNFYFGYLAVVIYMCSVQLQRTTVGNFAETYWVLFTQHGQSIVDHTKSDQHNVAMKKCLLHPLQNTHFYCTISPHHGKGNARAQKVRYWLSHGQRMYSFCKIRSSPQARRKAVWTLVKCTKPRILPRYLGLISLVTVTVDVISLEDWDNFFTKCL